MIVEIELGNKNAIARNLVQSSHSMRFNTQLSAVKVFINCAWFSLNRLLYRVSGIICLSLGYRPSIVVTSYCLVIPSGEFPNCLAVRQ